VIKEGNIDLHTLQRLILINNMREKCLYKLLLERYSESVIPVCRVVIPAYRESNKEHVVEKELILDKPE
jgi:hypothetical protein